MTSSLAIRNCAFRHHLLPLKFPSFNTILVISPIYSQLSLQLNRSNRFHLSSQLYSFTTATMSWMDSWSRPSKSQATPPPIYLTSPDVPYCHSCGRVISQRRTQPSKKNQEVKYCSARCRNTKPGPVDRKIEAVFAALLDGASPETLMGEEKGLEKEEKTKAVEGAGGFKGKKDHKKNKKSAKGDPRITIECSTAEYVVFQHEKDPEKVFGRRKNRAARGIIEKPEDWRSVDMVDDPPAAPEPSLKPHSAKDSVHSTSADDDHDDQNLQASDFTPSDDEEEDSGGITLPDTILLEPTYGYGGGKIRPPQSQSSINGSIGGEKGWAERIEETDEMKAKRREGQRRADEREMVRRAARRLVAFGTSAGAPGVAAGDGEKRKCEAVMKGVVVEASFAKGEWGIRWRETV
ncbi:hypothetical protein DM02DRAFT_34525 [Periconia macrospinosa]|uniref:Uncharacterized protein n=1 Tax=Periconia macrospinosa TaxID=97972 RepID=A0A2V1E6C2_9PLEO|nr:hypothetical protein DM02DRAFT_34525 [Periconia macrospinosa]